MASGYLNSGVGSFAGVGTWGCCGRGEFGWRRGMYVARSWRSWVRALVPGVRGLREWLVVCDCRVRPTPRPPTGTRLPKGGVGISGASWNVTVGITMRPPD